LAKWDRGGFLNFTREPQCAKYGSVGATVELGKFDPPLWHAPYGRNV